MVEKDQQGPAAASGLEHHPPPPFRGSPRSKHGCAMIELATIKHHHRLLHALAAAAGLSLGLALIDFCDAWFRQWLQRNPFYWSALTECIRAKIEKAREPIIFIRQHPSESVGAAVRR